MLYSNYTKRLVKFSCSFKQCFAAGAWKALVCYGSSPIGESRSKLLYSNWYVGIRQSIFMCIVFVNKCNTVASRICNFDNSSTMKPSLHHYKRTMGA